MKNWSKWLGALLTCVLALTLLFSLPTTAEAATYGDLTYSVSNGEVTITDCNESATGDLIIPDTIEGYPVTSIGSSAFYYCENLTSVMIPDSVTTISSSAFSCCAKLTRVTLGNNVTSIGGSAFSNCLKLVSINIPDSVTNIGAYAFNYCWSLTNINIPDDVTVIHESVFESCTSLTSIVIPDSVTVIEKWAFANCSSLTSITIPDGVTSIGRETFIRCSNLTSIRIPDGVTRIEKGMFYSCTSLKTITIPGGITAVEDDAFYNCSGLSAVMYKGTEELWNSITISSSNNSALTAATRHYVAQIACMFDQHDYLYCEDCDCCFDLTGALLAVYTVQFKNWDGSILSSGEYHQGDMVSAPEMPTKPADETYSYAFDGWDKEIVACDSEAIYTATFTPVYIDYTVIFENWDRAIISKKTYHYGDTVEIPADPTRAADNTYTYVFNSWDREVTACAGNTVYTATYTPTYIDYTVTFNDWDGTVLNTAAYHYGDAIIAPETPTRAADNTYTYAFSAWDKELVCTGNGVITATYTPSYIDYTVTFKDWDGTMLSTATYHYGDTIIAPETPTKAADNTYTYPFAGWDKPLVCAGDDVITATYTPTYIDYTVIFKDEDGTVISQKTYHYGDTVEIPTNPTKAADNTYTYTFAGWDTEISAVSGDATYTATYTPTYIDYTVTFKDWDGFPIEKKTYHYGDTVTAPADPIKAGDRVYTYAFTGWDPQVTVCTGDAVYTATYARAMIDYVVTFQNADGTVISQTTYHYGDTVEIPADFSAPEGYRFASWDKEIVTTVDGNAVYTAIYELDWIQGDFDSDDQVTDADALYLLRHTLFADRYPIPGDGDVDSDGSVTDADALYLLRHTLFSDRYPLYPTKEEI